MLPAILAGALVLITGAQIALTTPVALPAELPVGQHRTGYAIPRIPAGIVDPVILARPLFAQRRPMVGGTTVAQPPLGGVQLAGMVIAGGRKFVVLRKPDGGIANLAAGGVINGWRLLAFDEASASFLRGAERVTLAYSATGAGGTPAESSDAAQ